MLLATTILFLAALYCSLTRSVWMGGILVLALAVGLALPWNWRLPLLGGGLAAFFNYGPELSGSGAFSKGPIGLGGGGDATNPGDYLASAVYVGNGQGFSTEKPQFGL